MRTIRLILAVSLLMAAADVFAQSNGGQQETIKLGREMMPKDTAKTYRLKNHLIAPKGEWQCGLAVMYADFSTNNSEFMLLLQGLNANASLLRLAPEAAYTYKDNRAVGARFQYTKINGMVDSVTADLLGNLSLSANEINASSNSMGGCIFHRTYVGLDNCGRVGLFWDYVLGYTKSNTQFGTTQDSSSYSLNNKINLSFAPGIVYFPMNNVSIQACVSLAGLSYNNVRTFDHGHLVGNREAFKAYASLSILDLSFGLTVHL